MKKILSVILASLFIISTAVACGNNKAKESESVTSRTEASAALSSSVSSETDIPLESNSDSSSESTTQSTTISETESESISEFTESVTESEKVITYPSHLVSVPVKIDNPKVTEKITEKVTEKATEKATEKVTEKVTEKATEKATEKVTEKATEKATEKVTEQTAPKPIVVPVVKNDDTSQLHPFYTKLTEAMFKAAKNDNIVFSPVNLYTALAILAEAANGDSRSELLELLGLDSTEEAAALSASLIRSLTRDGERSITLLGSSLWLSENYPYKGKCADRIRDKHLAELFEGDFSSGEFIHELKSWLSEQTKGLLDDSIKEIDIDPTMICTVITTLYFKDKWENSFSNSKTEQRTFHAAAGDVKHDFMTDTDMTGRYYTGDGFVAVCLFYEEAGYLTLVLPSMGKSVESLLQNPDAASLMMYGRLDTSAVSYSAQVTVAVPKFDISYDAELSSILSELGAPSVFTPGKADLTSLLTSMDDPYAGIQHSVRLRIDEEGSEGAAYSAITMAPTSLPPSEKKMEIVFDRPFAFSLLSPNGEPLFTGIVNDPTKN